MYSRAVFSDVSVVFFFFISQTKVNARYDIHTPYNIRYIILCTTVTVTECGYVPKYYNIMKHIAGKHENSEKYLCVIYTRNTYLFLFTLLFYILCTLGYVLYIILYTTRRSQGMNVRVLYYYYTGNGGVNHRVRI